MKPYAFGHISSELAIFLADNEQFKYLCKNPAYLLFKGNWFLKCRPVQKITKCEDLSLVYYHFK